MMTAFQGISPEEFLTGYVDIKNLIDEQEDYYHLRDIDDSYGVLSVVYCMHHSPSQDIPSVIYGLGSSFTSEMADFSPLIVRLAILKDIYKNGGRYIHWILKYFLKDDEKNPLHHWRACQCSYEESFQKVIGTFLRDKSLSIPLEELVLNREKRPLIWWEEEVGLCLKGGE